MYSGCFHNIQIGDAHQYENNVACNVPPFFWSEQPFHNYVYLEQDAHPELEPPIVGACKKNVSVESVACNPDDKVPLMLSAPSSVAL